MLEDMNNKAFKWWDKIGDEARFKVIEEAYLRAATDKAVDKVKEMRCVK